MTTESKKPVVEGQDQIALFNNLQKQEKEACEESFAQFVRSAWTIWKPSDEVVWGWAQGYMCDVFQADMERIGAREPRNHRYTVVNVPPGSSKSTIASRMAQPWAWIQWPWMRFITSSHNGGLSESFSADSLNIINSDWYQENWGDKFSLLRNRRSAEWFANDKGGERIIASTGKSPVGKHCNIFGHDDPIDPEGSEYEKQIHIANRYCSRTSDQRLLPNGSIWLIMQRLNENDPTGYTIEKHRKRTLWICIPAEITANIKPEPPELEHFYKNGLFFPEYGNFTAEELAAKKEANPQVYATQYQQRPSPEEGGMFKRQNWRFWVPAGVYLPPVEFEIANETFYCENIELPASFDTIVNSWDFTFEPKLTSDFVSGQVIAQKGANYYVLDEFHDRIDFHQSMVEVIAMKKKWPLTSTIYYERKASGHAVGQELEDLIEGMVDVKATSAEGPKQRAVTVSATHKSKNIILPHPNICPWVKDYIDELAAWDNGKHDDRVVSMTQAIFKMRRSRPVLPGFAPKLQNYKIDWRNLDADSRLYISQYVSPDLQSSLILALWSTRTGRLLIFDEFTVSSTLPEYIKPMLEMKITRCSGGAITNLDRFQWYGNAFMFSRTRNTRSYAAVDGISETYIRAGVNVQDNLMYDEPGAVTILQRMIVAEAVLFDMKAAETIRQAGSWQYEGNEPAAGNGCIRAVCNIVSVLYEMNRGEQRKPELKAYSDKRSEISRTLSESGSQEDIDKVIKSILDRSRSYGRNKPELEKGWMV